MIARRKSIRTDAPHATQVRLMLYNNGGGTAVVYWCSMREIMKISMLNQFVQNMDCHI